MYSKIMTAPDAHRPTPGFLVWRLSMKWRVAVDRDLADLGVSHAQYALLGSLLGLHRLGHTPSQRELADHTGLEALYVSKLARALESAGWVERVRDPRDSRAIRLVLTPAGRQVTEQAVARVAALHERLLEPLGGPGSTRTLEFSRSVQALLDAPLRPDTA